MNLSTVRGRTIVATVFVALLSVFTLAQSPLATVSGRVLDPNGAAIIEATVTARNIDTGVTTTVQTNGSPKRLQRRPETGCRSPRCRQHFHELQHAGRECN